MKMKDGLKGLRFTNMIQRRNLGFCSARKVPEIDAPALAVPCICIPACATRTSISPWRKSLSPYPGPPGHHFSHSRVLPLFSVSRISGRRISRFHGRVVYMSLPLLDVYFICRSFEFNRVDPFVRRNN